MAISRFCCCCDLRRGCIAYAWLQMMCIALGVASMSIPLTIFAYSPDVDISNRNRRYYVNTAAVGAMSSLNILIAEQIIKGLTCLSLTWGVLKKQHMLYQPWLFVSGFENTLVTIAFVFCFFSGFAQPLTFTGLIPAGFLAGLGWYFWFCVYNVYEKDMKETDIYYEEYTTDRETLMSVM